MFKIRSHSNENIINLLFDHFNLYNDVTISKFYLGSKHYIKLEQSVNNGIDDDIKSIRSIVSNSTLRYDEKQNLPDVLTDFNLSSIPQEKNKITIPPVQHEHYGQHEENKNTPPPIQPEENKNTHPPIQPEENKNTPPPIQPEENKDNIVKSKKIIRTENWIKEKLLGTHRSRNVNVGYANYVKYFEYKYPERNPVSKDQFNVLVEECGFYRNKDSWMRKIIN
jgi:hypothetical protein